MNINSLKAAFMTTAGVIGGAIASLLGGWDDALITLCVFMALDFAMGTICAIVFKKSTKTATGAASSKAMWVGLCRKFFTLAIVAVAYRIDILLGSDFVRNAAIIAFCASEVLSIIENAGNMGVPVPDVIKKAVDTLQNKDK